MARIREDLVGSVLIENPAGGDPLVLVAGDKVPDGVELGAHVLAAKSGDSGSKGKSKGKTTPDTGKAVSEPQTTGELQVPTKVGAGSSTEAWRTYAATAAEKAGLSIDIPADAKRADIIAALESAKIATE